MCLASCLGIAPLGAVTMVGGSSDPSVPWSPGVTLQEKAGRPMGPSTLRCESPMGCCCGFCRGFCFWLFRSLSVLCAAVVISQGSVFIFCSFEPFTTRPVSVFYLLVLFFSCLVLSSTPCLSLSLCLSLSGAGETQTFLVWVSPCVSSTWTRSSTSIRTSSPTPTPRFRSRSCFFFVFFRRRSRWVVSSVLVFGGGRGSGLFSCGWWSWFGLRCSLVLLHLSCFRQNSVAGNPAAKAPASLPTTDWPVRGNPSPAGSRPLDGPIGGGLGVPALL